MSCDIKTAFVSTKNGVKKIEGCFSNWNGNPVLITNQGVIHNTKRKYRFTFDPKKVNQLSKPH